MLSCHFISQSIDATIILFVFTKRFVYPNNLTDSVAIRLGLSDADPLHIKRTQLLDALKIPKNCELDVLPSPKYISPKLLGFVRVFNMTEGTDTIPEVEGATVPFIVSHLIFRTPRSLVG